MNHPRFEAIFLDDKNIPSKGVDADYVSTFSLTGTGKTTQIPNNSFEKVSDAIDMHGVHTATIKACNMWDVGRGIINSYSKKGGTNDFSGNEIAMRHKNVIYFYSSDTVI